MHEVAKDFGLPTKTITEILTKYATAPKNHMQVLTDHELSLIFDYLTQHNQVANIQAIFAEAYQEKPAAKTETKDESKSAPAKEKAEGKAAPAKPQGTQPQAAAPKAETKAPQATQATTTRVPQKKIVDTRKGGDVNLAKYDERLETLGGERADRMQRQQRGGKEKIRSNNQRRGNMTFSNKRKQDEAERMRRLQLEIAKKAPVKVMIPDEISVGELASRMKKTGAEVVKCLMKNGVMASLSQLIDFDTAAIIAEELGCKVEKEVVVTIEEKLIDDHEDKPEDLVPRAPVVVVMGHVDHGKTSLLDTIRNTSVASGEAGGITQHIGAYQVQVNGKPITFLDTPGHEAFTSMRARGAMITDIAILMVAADDGIMPQTVESINHAKAANIPIIVAINKIDKPEANPDRVLQQLTEYGLVPEDWGGETICCKVSAKKNIGIENLLEMVTLTAEMEELKANPNRAGQGTVIEARLDKGRGPVATLLVQNGTLKQGDIIIAGTAVGRIRVMTDYKGNRLTEAGPSVPVEIAGLSEAPEAGSPFFAVADERMARELVEQRKAEARAKAAAPVQKVSLENLFDQIQAGERKELPLIVKADVQGSVEAVKASLEKLSNDEVNVRVIHGGVGAINESDVMLAASSSAIIVGFNVRPDAAARDGAVRQNVDMRMYRVIYDCIDEITAAMKGMLAPKYREVVLGHAEVRQTYKVSGVGTIAGCYVQDGKIVRNCSVRVVRDGIVIHEGHLASLKRFKDDAKEVAENYECGMTIEKFNDIKEGDIIEGFTMEEIPR
ncbi:translation initiation factor IF-2 [uncultured Oscillibacter sp.]|uniref:translation initiation factor IF-2 n=1 Tax=uncultured Oscillibacter sp. TaxID=876091 RepID=UPI0035A6E10A